MGNGEMRKRTGNDRGHSAHGKSPVCVCVCHDEGNPNLCVKGSLSLTHSTV